MKGKGKILKVENCVPGSVSVVQPLPGDGGEGEGDVRLSPALLYPHPPLTASAGGSH